MRHHVRSGRDRRPHLIHMLNAERRGPLTSAIALLALFLALTLGGGGADALAQTRPNGDHTLDWRDLNLSHAAIARLGLRLSDPEWSQAILTSASLQGEGGFLKKAHFAGANLEGANLAGISLRHVNLQHAVLDGATGLAGADLSQVVLNGASLRHVDLRHTLLYGAQLNGANLEGANLSGAFLTNNPDAGILEAASLVGAYLKNVNLSNADLSGANLTHASFYGSIPAGRGTCETSHGFTNACASAAGATLNNTHFTGAFLYGVDFTNAAIQGVQFANAVLTGANFSGAQLSVDPNVGTNAGFTNAFLQGAHLAWADLSGTTLQNAFVDFRPGGNDLSLLLDGTHAVFPGWQTPGQAVCVFVFYHIPTTVPTDNTTLTCPDGSAARANTPPGCGPTQATNTHWKSPVAIDHSASPASYRKRATYTKAAQMPICRPADGAW